MQIAQNSVVSIHYTLSNDAGEVLDSSAGAAPLVYLHGAQNIVPGLEQALDGRRTGDTFDVAVPPALGYGERDPEMLHEVPRSAFQGVDEIAPGMQFQAGGSGNGMPVVVTAVTSEMVSIDANHPLAGVTLNFKIEVVEVRDATDQERAHGHVHQGGHDH
jgi:FKBP-type peptidyl-prolyl cis-trans isomerase SlyD